MSYGVPSVQYNICRGITGAKMHPDFSLRVHSILCIIINRISQKRTASRGKTICSTFPGRSSTAAAPCTLHGRGAHPESVPLIKNPAFVHSCRQAAEVAACRCMRRLGLGCFFVAHPSLGVTVRLRFFPAAHKRVDGAARQNAQEEKGHGDDHVVVALPHEYQRAIERRVDGGREGKPVLQQKRQLHEKRQAAQGQRQLLSPDASGAQHFGAPKHLVQPFVRNWHISHLEMRLRMVSQHCHAISSPAGSK